MARPRHSFGHQPGRLVATMLRALGAELSDPSRYARGKAYARDEAVIDIDVRPGTVAGLVVGSRPDPYEAHLVVDPAPSDELAAVAPADGGDGGDAGERRGGGPRTTGAWTLLIPGRDELAVACTCPDAAGALCKHAVATLLVLADEVSIEPQLLVRWRMRAGIDGAEVGIGAAGSRRTAPATRLARRGRAAVPDPPENDPQRGGRPAAVDVLAGMLELGGELPELPDLEPVAVAPVPAAARADSLTALLEDLADDAVAAMRGTAAAAKRSTP